MTTIMRETATGAGRRSRMAAWRSLAPCALRCVQVSLLLLVALPAHAVTAVDGEARIIGYVADEGGIRLRSSDRVRSVSGRLDSGGRVVVTIVGQGVDPSLPRTLGQEEVAQLDGSGLIRTIELQLSSTGGLSVVTAVVEPLRTVTFRVSVDESEVLVALEPAADANPVAPRTSATGRRVLTDADLEPLPDVAPDNSVQPPQGVPLAARYAVNLRPEPSLDNEPLMLLPAGTPLLGTGRRGNWRQVRLGGLSGWVDGAYVEEREELASLVAAVAASAASEEATSAPLELGERGAWLDRLEESAGLGESPSWNDLAGGSQLAAGALSNRERALQEATTRQLETAESDLRAARAESAELRIALARTEQKLESALEQLSASQNRVFELEALVPELERSAVAARAALERSEAGRVELERRLEDQAAEREQLLLQSRESTDLRRQAQTQIALLEVEVEALRRALQDAEGELIALRTPGAAQTERVDSSGFETSRLDPELARQAIEEALSGWASAWSSGEAERYFGYYSRRFRKGGLGHESWRAQRRARLEGPEWIEVELGQLEISALPSESAELSRVRVAFQQSYRSPSYQDVVDKVLVMALEAGGWKILREQAAAVVATVPR